MNPNLPEILIADDEPTICFGLQTLLQGLGFRTHIAAEGRSAIEILQAGRGRVRVAFVDLKMPRESGIAVVQTAHALELTVHVCLMSAFHEELSSAMTTHWTLKKPFNLDE